MTTTNNTENDEEGEDADVQAIEEEFWPIATTTTTTITGGASILLAGHRTHAIYFGSRSSSSSTSSSDNDNNNNNNINNNNNNNDTKIINDSKCGGRVLRYKSMSSEAMTPLDMTYASGVLNDADIDADADDNVDADDEDEFYDGTGNLMWMAAVCFGHLVAQQIEPLRSYLSCDLPPPITTKHHHHRRRSLYHRRVCELGCGTGGAGISLLLFSNNNNNNNNPSAECESESTFGSKAKSESESESKFESESDSKSGSCHVVFTDNDIESLDLCKSNCELNKINPNNYSHRLLGWGLQQQQQKEQEQKVEVEQEEKNDHHHRYHFDDIDRYSFDTVLATDVVYDLKMIAPLLQTAEFLLKQRTTTITTTTTTNQDEDDDDDGGQLILSHIPRFCIPKNNEGDDVNDRRGENSDRNVDSDIKLGEQPNGDSDIVATSTSTSSTLYDNQAYLDLENFIQSEAIKVGLSLIETIRPHETLSNEYLFGHNDDDNDDDSMQQITLENMKEAHAVVFIFNRTRTLL